MRSASASSLKAGAVLPEGSDYVYTCIHIYIYVDTSIPDYDIGKYLGLHLYVYTYILLYTYGFWLRWPASRP